MLFRVVSNYPLLYFPGPGGWQFSSSSAHSCSVSPLGTNLSLSLWERSVAGRLKNVSQNLSSYLSFQITSSFGDLCIVGRILEHSCEMQVKLNKTCIQMTPLVLLSHVSGAQLSSQLCGLCTQFLLVGLVLHKGNLLRTCKLKLQQNLQKLINVIQCSSLIWCLWR